LDFREICKHYILQRQTSNRFDYNKEGDDSYSDEGSDSDVEEIDRRPSHLLIMNSKDFINNIEECKEELGTL
jgi:hypothetical protein